MNDYESLVVNTYNQKFNETKDQLAVLQKISDTFKTIISDNEFGKDLEEMWLKYITNINVKIETINDQLEKGYAKMKSKASEFDGYIKQLKEIENPKIYNIGSYCKKSFILGADKDGYPTATINILRMNYKPVVDSNGATSYTLDQESKKETQTIITIHDQADVKNIINIMNYNN